MGSDPLASMPSSPGTPGAVAGGIAPIMNSGAVGGTAPGADQATTGASGGDGLAKEEKKDSEVTLYPLRSYLDGEVRRAGGPGYKSPKHDATSLIAAGLATDEKPKA